jgi:hypothetical protein
MVMVLVFSGITLQNLTTFYLIVYVLGIQIFTGFLNNANFYMQYYVIQLTNFQAGIDTITVSSPPIVLTTAPACI